MLAVQAVSCSLIYAGLLIYCYAGAITIVIPAAYFVCGIALSGFLSCCPKPRQRQVRDHYLTIFQIAGHVALQLGFLLQRPKSAMLFSASCSDLRFGALRMTSRKQLLPVPHRHGFGPGFSVHPVRRSACPSRHIERIARNALLRPYDRTMCVRGLYGSSIRQSLYKRLRTQEAYKRIEELAELDELTAPSIVATFMRMLMTRIARAHRTRRLARSR